MCLCVPFIWRSLHFFIKIVLLLFLFLCYPYFGIFPFHVVTIFKLYDHKSEITLYFEKLYLKSAILTWVKSVWEDSGKNHPDNLVCLEDTEQRIHKLRKIKNCVIDEMEHSKIR